MLCSTAGGVDSVIPTSQLKDSYPYYLRPYQGDENDEIINKSYGFYVTHRNPKRRIISSSEFPLPFPKWLRSSHSKVSQPMKECQNNIISSSSCPKDPSFYQGTTWLQCLTYSQLPKEETKDIDDIVDWMKNELIGEHDLINQIRLTGGDDPGRGMVSVGPAIQVISLTIWNRTNSQLSIHGEISVPYNKNYNFSIFKRESHDPLSLVSHKLNYLPLDDCPIVPVIGGLVKFSITNVVDDSQIFDGYCDVDESIDTEEKSNLHLLGKDGSYLASMDFIKIPFAIIAKVEVSLLYTQPSTSSISGAGQSFKVHGKIIMNKVTCFDKESEEEGLTIFPEEECSFFMSRPVIAVPVCSPLVVEVELLRGGLKVFYDTIKFHPDSNAQFGIPPSRRLTYSCQEEGYSIIMHVVWIPYNEYGFSDVEAPSKVQKPAAAAAEVIKLPPITRTDTSPFFKVHPSARMSEDEYWDRFLARWTPPPVSSSDYVEVFSVFIGGGDSSTPPSIVGSIGVRDGDDIVYVFYRNAKCPDKLSNEQFRTLSLAWPTEWCILEEDFHMYLKLQDYQGREVCQGGLCLYHSFVKQYETRVCSVITSADYGYFAAVHYSIFKKGKRAKVSVEWDGEEEILVYGSVVAQYSNYTYYSTYDKEFYRSIIFKRSEEDAVSAKKSCKIPLSKSIVSAPSNCEGLTIHVNLKYCPLNDYFNKRDIIGNDLQFKAGEEAKLEICEGIIKVKVEWLPNSSNQ